MQADNRKDKEDLIKVLQERGYDIVRNKDELIKSGSSRYKRFCKCCTCNFCLGRGLGFDSLAEEV
jgi:hypothetical protein